MRNIVRCPKLGYFFGGLVFVSEKIKFDSQRLSPHFLVDGGTTGANLLFRILMVVI